jgi:N-acetylmuramic acid 6-phosphate etherase
VQSQTARPASKTSNAPTRASDPTTAGAAYLGIECGATRSAALLAPLDGGPSVRAEFGPANLRLLDDSALAGHFSAINGMHAGSCAALAGIVIGMAGMRTEADRQRIRDAAAKVWPQVPVYATNDLEPALMAARPAQAAKGARVLILSGTGSCCFGRTATGKTLRYGGWGHIIGDKGSGYEIGLRGLKAVVFYFDRDGKWPPLGRALLKAAQLNEPEDLIDWARAAEKPRIAALAVEVFAAAAKRDKIARDILAAAAESLAADGVHCARRLVKHGSPVEFILAGGVLLKQPSFARRIGARLEQLWPGAVVKPLEADSVQGCIELAKTHFGHLPTRAIEQAAALPSRRDAEGDIAMIPASGAMSPTEQRNARSMNLDQLPLSKAVKLMIDEESKVGAALARQARPIARAIEMIVASFQRGGRLLYVGAGTSGRLGILDAAECPPTFRVSSEQVQGIIAGGEWAICNSVEGAEDDGVAGAASIEHRGVGPRDVVVGITASGRTPFVWGALHAARRRKARTILLCFNPHLRIHPISKPDLVIAADVGPEVLTGSTRLKAGTATKIVLNILSTLSMVGMGKVIGNLMVDLNASNAKLRDRAVRIVQTISGASAADAQLALEKSGWIVKDACQQLSKRPQPGICLA